MKVALVHDYLKDAGGAERVLKVLTEIFPDAPVYTSFRVKDSEADKLFKDKVILESLLAPILRPWRLYSPLRFLVPIIWGSFDLSKYDLVITSASNYIAKGFKIGTNTKVICYCHTPPRFLYGFKTGLDWQKYPLVKVYGNLIKSFLKKYDYNAAQKINYWIANSINVQDRIKRFYGKDSTVIYPPVDVEKIIKASKNTNKSEYFLIVARLVGSKGLLEAVKAANELNINLKIVGTADGFTSVENELKSAGKSNIQFLGRLSDDELWKIYSGAKGFIALAKDEDFGMTAVESQAAGTPVIAFNGGGFKESIINNKTGILIDDLNINTLENAFKKFNKTKWDKKVIQNNAKKFSKENFKREMIKFVRKVMKNA